MGNGSSKRGDALSDHRRDEWAKRKGELEEAQRARLRAAAAREAAVEHAEARGKLESLSDVDWEEISNKLVDATLEGVRAGRDMRSGRVQPARDTPPPPSWHQTKGGKVGAVLAALTALGGLLQALRELGVF
jgi:hypothetical protein